MKKEKPLRTKNLMEFKDDMIIAPNGTGGTAYYLLKIKSSTVADVVTIDFPRLNIFTAVDKDFSKSTATYFIERSRVFIFDKLIRIVGYKR